MKKVYLHDRRDLLQQQQISSEPLCFTPETTGHLPYALRRYLAVCGYMGTPVPFSADVHWQESEIRLSTQRDWGQLQTLQCNTVNPIGRVAYMKFLSMPVAARDLYHHGYGEINGKLFNLFRIIFDNSLETAQSALITVFCEFPLIPGYLLSGQVSWEEVNDHLVKGTLRDHGLEVTGWFHFDREGFYTRFETDDRYYTEGKGHYRKVKFSAVVDGYQPQDGIQICRKVRIIWHLPQGDFEYYRGTIARIAWNVRAEPA